MGIDTRTELGAALSEAGEFGESRSALDAAHAAAAAIGDRRLVARARMARISLDLYSETMQGGGLAAAVSEAEAAIELFRAAGDDGGRSGRDDHHGDGIDDRPLRPCGGRR